MSTAYSTQSTMAQIIRDTAFGQLLRLITGRKVLQYPEEKLDFVLPAEYSSLLKAGVASPSSDQIPPAPEGVHTRASSSARSFRSENTRKQEKISSSSSTNNSGLFTNEFLSNEDDVVVTAATNNKDVNGNDVEAKIPASSASYNMTPPLGPELRDDGTVVIDWFSPSDPANPQNWPILRKAAVTFLICFYTFVVYTSSAIYTPSIEGVMHVFGVDYTVASLGLALYVLGYGTGPLLFSPLAEIPAVGRNPVYIITMFLFFIVSIPAAFVNNIPGLMILRFLQGFFGSPCLATGAATLGDMYDFMVLPYALTTWVSAAYCGPALGPLLAGFSVPAMGWRWSLYEIIWAAAPVTLVMFFFLPETLGENILRRRARRLRANSAILDPSQRSRLFSSSEKSEDKMTWSQVVGDALIKPFEITLKDPAVLFVQIYTAIIYGIYYSFFEVFPLVYPVMYGMSVGDMGLVFLCILISCLIGLAIYLSYLHYYLDPLVRAHGWPSQESRLIPALFAAFGPTIGLFVFAWTARPEIHWAVPTLGIVIYGATVFVVMQCIFVYVPLSYPQYAASLFAGNDFCRSALAFASVLFGYPLYTKLGVGNGTSLLGGLSTIGIIGIWALWKFGKKLRLMLHS